MKKLTSDQVQDGINLHSPEILLDKSTYVHTQIKCRFIDKDFGEFFAKPNNVLYRQDGHPKKRIEKIKQTKRENLENMRFGRLLVKTHVSKNNRVYWLCLCDCGKEKIISAKSLKKKTTVSCGCFRSELNKVRFSSENTAIIEKRKKTNLKKYGVEVPSQNKEIALKQAKKQNNSFVLLHWKTNEEVVCVGSYERKVVEYFNKNKIDFHWQILFNMPDSKTYTIDCFICFFIGCSQNTR